ncbi:DGQHR domain-containing protein DpdB [Micromonospora sp. NBC_01796]|uniref:DGQHR domain-containing protein DpdB n=1 Tax=Micromonospora sp. NBC_01796 TaxID=2975987 RepID=UPI002DDA09AA|nr:DGQHR domain-containing protein DpdB [Micromonospora sp. NBC_01796]WSA83861.1 DGQHR domain-containing protein DpdB [Micromonospora sp. NBC_01796]
MNDKSELRLPALKIDQGRGRAVYTFAIDGTLLPKIATVSRIKRPDGQVNGYQRPESGTHVAAIRRYLEDDPSPLMPNAIVVAFDERVRFETTPTGEAVPEYVQSGYLIVPATDGPEHERPGLIVDGQHRCAAIRDARVDAFPVAVNAFLADGVADQRSQFILLNRTRPLPTGLVNELLPTAAGTLPPLLHLRQLPATLLERLNSDAVRSPLYRMIKTTTNPGGYINDSNVLRMLQNSLTDGALYRLRNDEDMVRRGEAHTLLCNFWSAVREVFPEAWGKPVRNSRLMHGTGIISMGYLMDAIVHVRAVNDGIVATDQFVADLKLVAVDCHWTEGAWIFSGGQVHKWNDIENIPRHIQRLTDFLHSRYTLGRRQPTSPERESQR